MCVENYSYSTLQDQHKQTIKYNKSKITKTIIFFYIKSFVYTLNVEKIEPNQNILKTKKILLPTKT